MVKSARHRSAPPWRRRLSRRPLVAGLAACALASGAFAAWQQFQPFAPEAAASTRLPVAAPTVDPPTPSATASHTAPAKAPVHPPRHRTSAAPSPSGTPRATSGCEVAPADSIWRTKVDSLPTALRSDAYVGSIGAGEHVHADFGSGTYDGEPFGMPITDVPAGTPTTQLTFDESDESDKGPYHIPSDALVEGGAQASGDRHVIALDQQDCHLYELYDAHQQSDSSWHAGSGAIFDLTSDQLRTDGFTSADAAGLPIYPGLARYDEDKTGTIDHALRITVPHSQSAYLWPARHQASSSSDPDLPPMGLRLRLKASTDISGLPPQAKAIAQALKTYGAIVADNGSPWYISGTQDDHWDNDALHALDSLTGSDFEAVDESSLQISADSGAAHQP